MHRASLRIEGPLAADAAAALGPESGRDPPRTRSSVRMEGGACMVEVEAADATALRAALNSCLECARIVEDISKIAR